VNVYVPARGCPRAGGDHPSTTYVAARLQRPTRELGRAALGRSLSGLAPGGVYLAAPVARHAGGLLHHRFTLTAVLPEGRPAAVCSLWHCPAGHPGWALPTTLPCGARTFLGGPEGPTRPPVQLIRAGQTTPARGAPGGAGSGAEGVGFEPTRTGLSRPNGFQDRRFRPLSQPSRTAPRDYQRHPDGLRAGSRPRTRRPPAPLRRWSPTRAGTPGRRPCARSPRAR
jgi:hypothetical protein